MFSLAARPADLRPGERWKAAVRLKAPPPPVNPHGFDYELWLWEQGLQATGPVRAGLRDPPPKRLGPGVTRWSRRATRCATDRAEGGRPRLGRRAGGAGVGDQGAIEGAPTGTSSAPPAWRPPR